MMLTIQCQEFTSLTIIQLSSVPLLLSLFPRIFTSPPRRRPAVCRTNFGSDCGTKTRSCIDKPMDFWLWTESTTVAPLGISKGVGPKLDAKELIAHIDFDYMPKFLGFERAWIISPGLNHNLGPTVNLPSTKNSSALVFISSTSHLQLTNFPRRNSASLLVNQTVKSAGSLTGLFVSNCFSVVVSIRRKKPTLID